MSTKYLDSTGLSYFWGKIKGYFVKDVQINGTSVVTNGVASVPTEVFIATYGATTYADISAALSAGKSVFVNNSGGYLPLVYNGSGRTDGHIFCGVIGDISSSNMLGYACCASNNNWSMRAFTPADSSHTHTKSAITDFFHDHGKQLFIRR